MISYNYLFYRLKHKKTKLRGT